MLAVLSFSATSSALDYTEIAKELEIMDSVLTTSLKQDNSENDIQFRSLNAKYLAKQGVVFQVATSQSNSRLHFISGTSYFAPTPPEPPAFPTVLSSTNQRILEEQQATLAKAFEGQTRFIFGQSNDKIRDVQQSLRETEWQLRDYQRQLRDLNFELRTASEARKKEIETAQIALEKQSKDYTKQQKALSEKAKEIRLEIEKELEQQQAKANANRKAFLSHFEEDIADNLCRFGGGLRALPSDENVSFVLENFNASDNWEGKDRIYVFPIKEIKNCVQDKIKTKDLLAKATVYDF
jgi:hypothetical protein